MPSVPQYQMTWPLENVVVATKSDATDEDFESRLLICLTDGTPKVTTAGGQDVTLPPMVAGDILPIRVTRVWNSGTTGTYLLGY